MNIRGPLNSTPISMKYEILKITPFQNRRNHGLHVRTDWCYPTEYVHWCHEPVTVRGADFIQDIMNCRCL